MHFHACAHCGHTWHHEEPRDDISEGAHTTMHTCRCGRGCRIALKEQMAKAISECVSDGKPVDQFLVALGLRIMSNK